MSKQLLLFGFTILVCLLRSYGQISMNADELSFTSQSGNFEKSGVTFRTKEVSLDSNDLIHFTSGKLRASLNPAFDLWGGVQGAGDEVPFNLAGGFDFKANYNRWSARFTFLHAQSKLLGYQESFVNQYKVLPAYGLFEGSSVLNSNYIDAFIRYQSKKYFTFDLGYGRNFIGDGYRSLLLSDFGGASPYFKLQTKFWKITYTNLFAAHSQIYGVESHRDLFETKFTATHFLDWQVTKWLSLGLFESIVWGNSESKFNRGFEVSYLNPVIFYRPVEFSVGSSDNALVGANLKLIPSRSQKVYFQLLLDEFLLRELRADFNQFRSPDKDIRSGWWANKYGIQIGWQGQNDLGVEGLSHLVEFNLVRPYTYAHSSPTQAYSHQSLSLAHPLGANFTEGIARISYSAKNRFSYRLQYNQSYRGVSDQGLNYGDNLELSNASRELEYENKIGQGTQFWTRIVDAQISYLIKAEWNATLSLGAFWRETKGIDQFNKDQMLYLRLRTNIFSQQFDF